MPPPVGTEWIAGVSSGVWMVAYVGVMAASFVARYSLSSLFGLNGGGAGDPIAPL